MQNSNPTPYNPATFVQTTPKTATNTYNQQRVVTMQLVAMLGTQLGVHQVEQASEPHHWGYAGDLHDVNEKLACILATLGDRTMVDKLGIPY